MAPSGLRADVDRILRWQIVIIPPVALLFLLRQLNLHDDWRATSALTISAPRRNSTRHHSARDERRTSTSSK